jgi:hypothetical protein
MLSVWGVCVLLILMHAQAVRAYIGLFDQVGLRGAGEAATPQQHVIPSRYADTQTWVRHALAGHDADTARVRFTRTDNAPDGREVHWASPLAWLIRLGDRADGFERGLIGFNAYLLPVLMVLLSGWAAARAGAGAGVLVALAMLGHTRFYEAFAPANVDHHGLLAASVLGLCLGLGFMGGGWWKPNLGGTFTTLLPSEVGRARRAAFASATWGAFGLWISAASVLPAIAIAGLAGLLIARWGGAAARRDAARFDPGAWRLWGRAGAGLSLLFYLVEYAPDHLGLRLEVNHPLYAVGWWGGAEIVAFLGARFAEGGRVLPGAIRALALPVLAVLAVPATMFIGGEEVFVLRDPFIADLRHFVIEGNSLPAAAQTLGFAAIAYPLASCLLLVPAFALARRARGEGTVLIGFPLVVAVGFIALGFWEVRWWLVGSATQIVLLLAVIAGTRRRWTWVIAVSVLLLLPASVQRILSAQAAVRDGIVDQRDILQPLYRDIAATLRASQPEGDIVLLTNPNASVGIGYYGGFQTLGTLYWENAPGLKAAAAILCARTDAEAERLVRQRGLTHVALLSAASFHTEYFTLLHPGAPLTGLKETFGHRLATGQAEVSWLQPIPYRKPADLALAPTTVALFRVDFTQTEPERLFQTAVARVAAGDIPAGEKALAALAEITPADSQPGLYEVIAADFYHFGADIAAARAFQRVLAFGPNPSVTTTLAWILATTSDNTLRDGHAALALVQPIAQMEPDDPTVLSTLAAALAEAGRPADAIAPAVRALEAARAAGDTAALPLLQQRLDTYRANRPWRQ